MSFFIIADSHTFLAFALAGIKGGVAVTPAEARDLLARALADQEVGLVLITERLAQQIRGEVDGARRERVKPLILEIPDLEGPGEKKESLLDRLRAVMGIPK